MKTIGSFALPAILIGLGFAALPEVARAESNTALLHAEVHKACVARGGRFERSWRYNDHGARWGRTVSCRTESGFISCQDSVCRSNHWERPDPVKVLTSASEGTGTPAQ